MYLKLQLRFVAWYIFNNYALGSGVCISVPLSAARFHYLIYFQPLRTEVSVNMYHQKRQILISLVYLHLLTENNSYYLLKITKKTLLSIILVLSLPSQRAPTQIYPWFFSGMTFFRRFFLSLPSIINLFNIFFLDMFPWYIFWYFPCQICILYH